MKNSLQIILVFKTKRMDYLHGEQREKLFLATQAFHAYS
tara:strand:- start:276 stop:392 length:117 start_codon:yes stop_codon:yes gene_type:complete